MENEEETEEVCLDSSKKKKQLGLPRNIPGLLTRRFNLLFDVDEEEEPEDYLVYQPLVYPSGTTPPTSPVTKRMNFIDFNLRL